MPSVVSSLEKERDRVKERAIQAQAAHYRRLEWDRLRQAEKPVEKEADTI